MAKITLNDIGNITGNETAAIAAINENNTLIETAIENTLSRDGTSPNQMNHDFDMNGYDVLNAGVINAESAFIDGVDITAVAGPTGPAGATGATGPTGATGAAGAAGATGATGAAGANGSNGSNGSNGTNGTSFIWKGTYSGATAYVANDVAFDQGSSWINILASTGNAPPTLPTTSNTWWNLAAKVGDTGASGSGSGDVVGPASSVDSEIAIYSGTTGKIIKRASTTGLLKGTSGVISAASAGTDYYNPGGTDVAVADGGTGSSTAAGAATNLGLGTGDSPQFTAVNIGAATDTTVTRVSAGVIAVEGNTVLTAATGQPLDSDLTTIAGLTATTDNFIQSKSSAWASRTPTQVTADLIAMVGDSGSGGTKGLVPAPSSGDAAASKFLKADGTWTAVSASGAAATQLSSPVNLGFSASVSSNALTITMVGVNGSNPAVGNEVYIPFRNVTAATGTPSYLTITAATSIVISSGSTMGFTSAVLGKLWIVGFNDGGTFRLGLVNCLSGTSIMALADGIYSSTAEGGAGAADSAQVIYTGTAVTSKAMTVLGYLEATEATAGTWATTPSKLQTITPGTPLPGRVIQIQRTDTSSTANGTTTMPADDTIPQNTEGVQFMTQAITPTSAGNLIRVSSIFLGANTGTNNRITSALFQDSVANAVKAVQRYENAAGEVVLPMNYVALAATTSSTTFKIRVGGSAAGTMHFNGESGRLYGGVSGSYIECAEIVA